MRQARVATAPSGDGGDAGTGLAGTFRDRGGAPGGRAGRGGGLRRARAVGGGAGQRLRGRHLGCREPELHVLQPGHPRPARRLPGRGPGLLPVAALEGEERDRDDRGRDAGPGLQLAGRHRRRRAGARGLPDGAGREPAAPRPRDQQPVRPQDRLLRQLGRPLPRARQRARDRQHQSGRGRADHGLAQRRRGLPGAVRGRQADERDRLRVRRRRARPAHGTGRRRRLRAPQGRRLVLRLRPRRPRRAAEGDPLRPRLPLGDRQPAQRPGPVHRRRGRRRRRPAGHHRPVHEHGRQGRRQDSGRPPSASTRTWGSALPSWPRRSGRSGASSTT